MAHRLNVKVNLLDLDGKSGKFSVNEDHAIVELRDGTIVVFAVGTKPRAPRQTQLPSVQHNTQPENATPTINIDNI